MELTYDKKKTTYEIIRLAGYYDFILSYSGWVWSWY